MASLVCRWLEMTQPELPAGGAAGAAAAGPSGGGDGGAGGTPGAAAGGSAAAGPGGAATAGQAQQAARPRLDEAFYLRQLAKVGGLFGQRCTVFRPERCECEETDAERFSGSAATL